MDLTFKNGFLKSAGPYRAESFMSPHVLATNEENLIHMMGQLTSEEQEQLETINKAKAVGAITAAAGAGAGLFGLARAGVRPGILGAITGLAGAGLAAMNYFQDKEEIDTGLIGTKYMIDRTEQGPEFYIQKAGLL